MVSLAVITRQAVSIARHTYGRGSHRGSSVSGGGGTDSLSRILNCSGGKHKWTYDLLFLLLFRVRMGDRMLAMLLLVLLSCVLSMCEGKRDYYTTLEVERSASKQDIKKAFRKMALRYHPDKNPGKDTTKKFRAVAEAYEVLGDVEKRRQYDSQGHGAWDGAGAGGFRPGNFDFDDLFKDFDDDFFKEMGVDLKGHFASHFGTHKANQEATGGQFNLNDINFRDMFKDTFKNMVGDNVEVSGSQKCRTVTVKHGNSETTTTQCETVTSASSQSSEELEWGEKPGGRIEF